MNKGNRAVDALSVSRRFARWAVELGYESLPDVVIDKLKAVILLHLVGAVFGVVSPAASRIASLTELENPRSDGASVFGRAARVSREGAIVANAFILHAAGMYDSYRMLTHPGPALIPVGLANAELCDKSPKDLLVALAVGYEFECRLARDHVPAVAARGFRPAPVFGTMGAAVVAGKLLDLSESEMVTAIAIAANGAAGLNEANRSGGQEIELHEAAAARYGSWAALMAGLDVVAGSERIIEGQAGFFASYAGSSGGRLSHSFDHTKWSDPGEIVVDLGSIYQLCNVTFRIFPVSGYVQPVIELMRELVDRFALTADKVDAITITMNPLEIYHPSPAPGQSDLSAPRPDRVGRFASEVIAYGGYPILGQTPFSPPDVDPDSDEVLEALVRRVNVVGSDDSEVFAPTISIRLTDGGLHQATYDATRLEWRFEQLAARLQGTVAGLPGGRRSLDRLVELSSGFERLESVSSLFEAVRDIQEGAR